MDWFLRTDAVTWWIRTDQQEWHEANCYVCFLRIADYIDYRYFLKWGCCPVLSMPSRFKKGVFCLLCKSLGFFRDEWNWMKHWNILKCLGKSWKIRTQSGHPVSYIVKLCDRSTIFGAGTGMSYMQQHCHHRGEALYENIHQKSGCMTVPHPKLGCCIVRIVSDGNCTSITPQKHCISTLAADTIAWSKANLIGGRLVCWWLTCNYTILYLYILWYPMICRTRSSFGTLNGMVWQWRSDGIPSHDLC